MNESFIEVTSLDGKTRFIRVGAIRVITPTDTGCRIFLDEGDVYTSTPYNRVKEYLGWVDPT